MPVEQKQQQLKQRHKQKQQSLKRSILSSFFLNIIFHLPLAKDFLGRNVLLLSPLLYMKQ